jgi:hypothetical protein
MKFRYLSESLGQEPFDRVRPMLRVLVVGPRGRARALMLVDSGADETLIPTALADGLGIASTGEECALATVTSGLEPPGKVGLAQLQFGGGRFSFQSRVVSHPHVRVPVLGHSDFFERYRVTFDAANRLFFVEEARTSH